MVIIAAEKAGMPEPNKHDDAMLHLLSLPLVLFLLIERLTIVVGWFGDWGTAAQTC
jgi:hypothetical protein